METPAERAAIVVELVQPCKRRCPGRFRASADVGPGDSFQVSGDTGAEVSLRTACRNSSRGISWLPR
ncbi:MAG: hypothetical protein OEW72_09525, partial [Gammaproteobacteria bacterium]|nr:hypothetical protein [Gammaproteobacteria bacterium]